MLDLQYIRDHPEEVKRNVKIRGLTPKEVDIDYFLDVDKRYREMLQLVEEMRARRNELSDLIAREKSSELLKEAATLKEKLKQEEVELNSLENECLEIWRNIPNMAAQNVPAGQDENENIVVRKWGEPTHFDFIARDHLEIGESLGLIDVERAGKASGSRFSYLVGELVILELSLFRFAIDWLVKEGFIPVIPPVMIKKEMEEGLGYGEHGGWEDMYVLEEDGLVLVGTSEHALIARHAGEVLPSGSLPCRYVGISTCFRREAGSYGRDTRGLLRSHQFNKVEMISFVRPEESAKEFKYLLSLEEDLMQALKLPYQIVQMCTGDLGQPASEKYDIEAWLPGQDKYRETHSVSNCTDYQARRLNIKCRSGEQKDFVHILNGTAFSERPLIAILENYQQADGSVKIPEVLVKYTGFSEIGMLKVKSEK
ncbi:serine--tRNA ligase [Patescibacteria group bacterium]|nr:serine--tRNA ligase [Patescibacteria group bacterium]